MEKEWYEIYECMPSGGTRTIEICETLEEAKDVRGHLISLSKGITVLAIDKWEMNEEDCVPTLVEKIL